MLSGFNTNVRHKGVLFHVQTEDSGLGKPHVITHLFHGGNILASEKRSYEHLLEAEDLPAQVKRLMDEQHKAMLEKLRSGGHDAVIRERLGSGARKAASGDVTSPPIPAAAEPEAPKRAPDAPEPVPAAARAAERAPEPPPAADRQRPLDEVVLDYLLDSARQRSKR
jgi:hypothetical protein